MKFIQNINFLFYLSDIIEGPVDVLLVHIDV